jgi:hypothetical protein
VKLIPRRIWKKNSKNLKIVQDYATLLKSGLAPVGLVHPLGIKDYLTTKEEMDI